MEWLKLPKLWLCVIYVHKLDAWTHQKYRVAVPLTKYIKLFDELQLCDYGIILFKYNLVCRSNLDINKLKGVVCACVILSLTSFINRFNHGEGISYVFWEEKIL